MNFFYPIPENCLQTIREDLSEADCFRITKYAPPIQEDFCPQLFRQPEDERTVSDPCRFCGASVFINIEYAKKQLKKYKKLGKYLFRGHVQSAIHGPLTRAGSLHHYNWFQYEDVNPAEVFMEQTHEF